MAKFAYNNIKNMNIGHMLFMLNCGYYPCVFFKENINLHPQSKKANKLLAKLQKLITIC